MSKSDWKNKLYFGDNLDIMRKYITDESVDLIYLDPPFNSKASYNVLYREANGSQSSAQITAFEDTWHWDIKAEEAYYEVVEQGPRKVADLLQALIQFLRRNDMMAYLVMMTIRLVELHRVLKSTGSIYLHCDPTASHYLKLVMDAVFGHKHFRNEIIWHYRRWSAPGKQFQRMHDVILFYTKTEDYLFNKVKTKPTKIHQKKFDKGWDQNVVLINGERKPQLIVYDREKVKQAVKKGRLDTSKFARTVYKEETMVLASDIITDIPIINSQARERLGYPTQKPEALLERIIKASSNERDIVLDPFCGCGTTVAVAEQLNRHWIGIDITHLAIALIKHRLEDTFGAELSPYEVLGDPKDLRSAEALAKQSPYQFEWWAIGLVDAFPVGKQKKGADRGIDGYINFFDDDTRKAKSVVVQVKSGHVTVSQIRDLRGVLERENATIGAFITLRNPTKPMLKEAASAGFYESPKFPGRRFPRIQILTIADLLAGKQLECPRQGIGTFKKAKRKYKENKIQTSFLPDDND